jgi:hypothetical protein
MTIIVPLPKQGIPPRSGRPSAQEARPAGQSLRQHRAKIISKIVAYFSHLKKAHPNTTIHHTKHHDLTIKSPHQTPIFFQNSFKNTHKDEKTTPRSISGFFPEKPHDPATHPAASTADKVA